MAMYSSRSINVDLAGGHLIGQRRVSHGVELWILTASSSSRATSRAVASMSLAAFARQAQHDVGAESRNPRPRLRAMASTNAS